MGPKMGQNMVSLDPFGTPFGVILDPYLDPWPGSNAEMYGKLAIPGSILGPLLGTLAGHPQEAIYEPQRPNHNKTRC